MCILSHYTQLCKFLLVQAMIYIYNFVDSAVGVNELRRAMIKMKNGKSAGKGGIIILQLLKNISRLRLILLAKIFS